MTMKFGRQSISVLLHAVKMPPILAESKRRRRVNIWTRRIHAISVRPTTALRKEVEVVVVHSPAQTTFRHYNVLMLCIFSLRPRKNVAST